MRNKGGKTNEIICIEIQHSHNADDFGDHSRDNVADRV